MRPSTLVFLLAVLSGVPSVILAQEQSHPATPEKTASTPAQGPGSDKAATESGQPQKKSGAEENPFPEAQSESAAREARSGQVRAAPADEAGEGSSSAAGQPPDGQGANSTDEGVSSSRTRLEGLDDSDPDASRKEQKSIAQPVHNPKMAAEDIGIGKMYFQTENYRGAYIRYKEALSLDPENADAAFGIAESARKMNQMDEAAQNYKLYLNLDPDGRRAKAARKALAEIAKSAR